MSGVVFEQVFYLQDPKLVSWAHETLIQLLNSDLLPVYLDVLQILKSKVLRCPYMYVDMVSSKHKLISIEIIL